jgi:predicted amidohydrolase
MKLKVATCQFPVSSDIRANLSHVLRQISSASDLGAAVVHFPEACLSGYAGIDFESHIGFGWDLLRESAQQVFDHARKEHVWVILGSAHKLSGSHKPHNSLYITNDRGMLVDRYDKLFCAGNRSGTEGDLAHYTSGDHFSVFNIGGIRCGALICHDYRYPELYREYKRRGVQLMFHSYHAGNVTPSRLKKIQKQVGPRYFRFNHGTTYPEITMPATMQANAASSHVWISCSNTSARHSCWSAFFVRADGVITGRLRRNSTGVLISEVDTDAPIYESTAAWRDNALRGILHSGKLVRDKRSSERDKL